MYIVSQPDKSSVGVVGGAIGGGLAVVVGIFAISFIVIRRGHIKFHCKGIAECNITTRLLHE